MLRRHARVHKYWLPRSSRVARGSCEAGRRRSSVARCPRAEAGGHDNNRQSPAQRCHPGQSRQRRRRAGTHAGVRPATRCPGEQLRRGSRAPAEAGPGTRRASGLTSPHGVIPAGAAEGGGVPGPMPERVRSRGVSGIGSGVGPGSAGLRPLSGMTVGGAGARAGHANPRAPTGSRAGRAPLRSGGACLPSRARGACA